jgi:hypothetical protein
MMNEYMMKALIKQGKRSDQKIEKTQISLKNAPGDAILLAATVAYLGALPMDKRMLVRKEIAERLLVDGNIESSEYWSNTAND